MTYEEVLYSLCEDCVHYPCYALKHGDNCWAYNTIKQALEKQIPKKPTFEVVGGHTAKLCPVCGAHVWTYKNGYLPICHNCYQVIDWSDEE